MPSLFSGYTDTLLCAGFFLVSYSLLHHDHHHHHLGNMELRHLWTRSGLTHPEVSLMFSPGFFCHFVCIFFIILGNLIRGILLICCSQFLLYSCILSKTGVLRVLLQTLCLFYNLSQCILLFFSRILCLLLLFLFRLLL